jgi:selenide,water dikinase
MAELTQVLRHVLPVDDPRALVDASTGDDAAVYRLSADRALVVTTDFFTPVVDDPFDFGRIAAANALSDVYAMGAKPLFALNLLAFPRKLLGEGLAAEIVRGGGEICREAGIPVLGGHSIDDPEPKFGMVAIGEVHPDHVVTLRAALPGDRLVLTKAIGTGVISTAIKAGAAEDGVVAEAVRSMTTLNRPGAEAMIAHGVRAGTDVTGFGLLGHLRNMLKASGLAAEIDSTSVPLLPGAIDLVRAGHIPGGTKRNSADLAGDVAWDSGVAPETRTLLTDAQTSGGLLMAVPPGRLDALLAELDGRVPALAVIGELAVGRVGSIRVL